MSSHWYETFFDGLAVEMWDAVDTPAWTNPEVDFLAKALGLKAGETFLDIACGSGRHAKALAALGYRGTGLDLSGSFLEIARRDRSIEWIHANMLDLPNRQFDAAYCWGNAFGYLEHADTVRFIGGLGRVIRPGGRFILETGAVAESLLAAFKTRSEGKIGDIEMVTERSYDVRASQYVGTYILRKDGREEAKPMRQCVYTSGELVRMFGAAGFRVVEMYGGTDMTPFELGSRHLILVTERS